MSIPNPATQPEILAAQIAICNTPGGKWFVKRLARKYRIQDLIQLLCKHPDEFLDKIIKIIKDSGQIPRQTREHLEQNRQKYIIALKNIKTKYKLNVTCSKIGFIKTKEGFDKLFDALFKLFCVIPFGPTITKKNSKNVFNATLKLKKVFNDGKNNSHIQPSYINMSNTSESTNTYIESSNSLVPSTNAHIESSNSLVPTTNTHIESSNSLVPSSPAIGGKYRIHRKTKRNIRKNKKTIKHRRA